MTERRLATIERVADVRPVENSDNLNVLTVRGWQVVSNRESGLASGDSVVYFELDSMLPIDDPRFEFLAARSTRERADGTKVHVLKTARLRGQYSQGLVIPIEEFRPELEDHVLVESGVPLAGQDVTELLGIEKYEAPLPKGGNANTAGAYPAHLGLKTDSERVQNLNLIYDTILDSGPWLATEKVDGTSLSVFRGPDDEPIVCSRNWQLKDGDNWYWQMVREHDLLNLVYPFQGIQAEIFGPGIQGNPLRVNHVQIRVFAFLDHGVPQPRELWPAELQAIAVPVYEGLVLADSVAGAVAQVVAINSLVSPGRLAEGVVWHRLNGGPNDFALNGRHNFKAISNKYLLKNDG